MLKPREWDCGTWDTSSDHNRITIRERGDGLYELIHVCYVRTAQGMHKSESVAGIARSLAEARERGWELWRRLSDVR